MARLKAYDPQEGCKYQILCRNRREWEHCDYAKDEQERRYLLGEYRLAYGAGWEFRCLLLPPKYHPKPEPTHG